MIPTSKANDEPMEFIGVLLLLIEAVLHTKRLDSSRVRVYLSV